MKSVREPNTIFDGVQSLPGEASGKGIFHVIEA